LKIKHIYWFASYNLNGPSTRYRGYYPLSFLDRHYKIKNDFIFPQRNSLGIFKFLKIALTILFFRKKNSLIVIQKICSNRLYANTLKLLIFFQSKHTQYDLDDAEYLRQDTKSLHFFLKKCKVISVGSEELKKYCLSFNSNVFILTSPVTEHKIIKKKRNKIPNIGWVGDFGNGDIIQKEFSHKTSMYNILFPQIKKISIPIKLTLIGIKNQSDIPEIIEYFKNTPNINIEIPINLEWKNDYWVYKMITKFDIGVSPMVQHLYNRSKSAFKAKQYLSVGIPTIASNVGENNKFVFHNKNGIICNNKNDFYTAICNIINMSDKEYFNFSKNAINHKNEYSMKNYCEMLLKIYK